MGPREDDPPMVRIPRDVIPSKRMNDLMSRYKMPSSYIYRSLGNGEYVSTSGPLEVVMC